MPDLTIDELKYKFRTGAIPTGADFSDFVDLLYTKSVPIPLDAISGLIDLLTAYSFAPIIRNVTGNHNEDVQNDKMCFKIIVIPSANAAIKIGTSNGGDEISMVTVNMLANQKYIFDVEVFGDDNPVIYSSGFPANSKIIFYKLKFK